MGISIKELSTISGFSTATISRVIAGKDNVKKETREAIEKLLLEHNYRINIMDIRNKGSQKKTILILVGDLQNWYYMETVRFLTAEIIKKDYIPLLAYTNDSSELEEYYVQMAILDNYASVVFINVQGNNQLKQLLKSKQVPTVFLNRGMKASSFDTVCNDNYHSSYKITHYLIQCGHKKIGHLSGGHLSNTSIERRRGYEDAMFDNGLVVSQSSIIVGGINYESGFDAGIKIAKSSLDYTALFCSNYRMLEGLLDAFNQCGIHIPDDISIVSFDEAPFTRRAHITTICTDPEKMANTAVNLLLERISNPKKDASTIYLQAKMNTRNSVKLI